MSLYRKYRPRKFADVIGQEHVKKTLANAIKLDEVVHGYLFSGSRGIGKTSIARILAMALNCDNRSPDGEPCGQCVSCAGIISGADLNVMEIDAASNRGIDEIRALRDSVAIVPPAGKKKVYIIDEVHMLTKEAFNALLKTLEEPPNHAIFVLATTEVERIPDTIISRIQHFEFKRATIEQLKSQLTDIAAKEDLVIEPAALDLIITQADGGFRDSLTILNQIQSLGEAKITVKSVESNLGLVSAAELSSLVTASLKKDVAGLQEKIAGLNEAGFKPSGIIDSLINTYRFGLWRAYGVEMPTGQAQAIVEVVERLSQTQPSYLQRQILRLLRAKQQLRWSPLPMLPIELAMIPESLPEVKTSSSVARAPEKKDTPKLTEPAQAPNVPNSALLQKAELAIEAQDKLKQRKNMAEEMTKVQVEKESNADPKTSTGINEDVLAKAWPEVVAEIRLENASLGALLRSCQLVGAADNELVIQVPFSFYGDRIADNKNESLINAKVKSKLGVTGKIRCQLAENQTPATPPTPPPMIKNEETKPTNQPTDPKQSGEKSILQAAQEIFGVRSE